MMVTNNYTPYSGGVVSSLQATCHELRKLGHQVIIVTLDFLGKNDGYDDQDVYRLFCFMRFKYRGNYMAIPWRARRQIQKLIVDYQPDVVHVHHPFLLGVAAMRVALQYAIPIIFTHHTLYEKYVHYVPCPEKLARSVVRYLVKNFCKKVHAVVAPSVSVQNYLASQNIITTVVPSGILSCFVPQQIIVPKSCGPKWQLLVVCRFMPEKNLKFLLEMLGHLPDNFCLTLIGYGAQLEELQQYAFVVLKLSADRIQFIIKPDREVIRNWYEKAHLFIFASTTETQGLVLAEAMAWGTPVVALRGPGVVDIVKDGYNGYVIDSAQQMAEKIEHLYNNKEEYVALQQGAFQTGQEYYPEATIMKLCKVYEEMLL